jgi:hypothetical protein
MKEAGCCSAAKAEADPYYCAEFKLSAPRARADVQPIVGFRWAFCPPSGRAVQGLDAVRRGICADSGELTQDVRAGGAERANAGRT